MTSKVKAFTIIEMIMSLIISSVLIGIIYSIFLIISTQVENYQQRSGAIAGFLILRNVMERDFVKASIIRASPGLLNLNCPDENIRYEFNDEFIRRYDNNTVDSFFIKSYRHQTTYVSDALQLVTSFQAEVVVGKEKSKLIFKKKYSAVELINAENTNIYE